MIGVLRLGPRPAPSRNPVLYPYLIKRSDRCINCGNLSPVDASV